MQYSFKFQQFEKYFIKTNYVYYTTEWHFPLMHDMCFSGLWESETKHWNQRTNTKKLLSILAAPWVGGKRQPRGQPTLTLQSPGTQRFQWLKQYSTGCKGSEKPKLGLWAPCLLHIEMYNKQRVHDVQIIDCSFGFEFMVLKYIMILQDQHQVTKQLYLKEW